MREVGLIAERDVRRHGVADPRDAEDLRLEHAVEPRRRRKAGRIGPDGLEPGDIHEPRAVPENAPVVPLFIVIHKRGNVKMACFRRGSQGDLVIGPQPLFPGFNLEAVQCRITETSDRLELFGAVALGLGAVTQPDQLVPGILRGTRPACSPRRPLSPERIQLTLGEGEGRKPFLNIPGGQVLVAVQVYGEASVAFLPRLGVGRVGDHVLAQNLVDVGAGVAEIRPGGEGKIYIEP